MGSLELLRSFSGRVADYNQKTALSYSAIPGGIPEGGLTELVGPGKTSLFLGFLAEHPEMQAAWVETQTTLYPFGVRKKGVQLSQVFYVEAGEQMVWSVLQVIRSGVFSAVAVAGEVPDLMDLRRIQLAAEAAKTTVFFLVDEPSNLWPIRLSIHADELELDEEYA
jgi:hypothetical protein